jgi:hypothetical protein
VQVICDEIWQPLLATSLWNRSDIRSFLVEVSSILLQTSSESESRWRNTTLAAVTHTTDAVEAFIGHLEGKIMPKVQLLLTDIALFQQKLKEILIDAILFWEEVQKDGSRISVLTVPLAPSWDEALPFIMPEEDLRGALPPPSKSMEFGPLLIFPEIVRHSFARPADIRNDNMIKVEAEQDRVLCRGVALFPETCLFDMGREEQVAIAEATKQVTFQIGSRKRNSVSTKMEVT